MSDTAQKPSPLLAYHARTRHCFEAFAEGPGQLDWDAQPAAFRHYLGAPRTALPLAADRFERPYSQLSYAPNLVVAPELSSLGALLELSYGISAWKNWGPNRWALRCNPSSGNLHPVEAYVLCAGLPGVSDGLHHYDPESHALEGRAMTPPTGDPWLAVGLSSVMWREAWKYGERAFRYCQLDIGHAIATISFAAALLGWRIYPRPLASATLTRILGIDRAEDFPGGRYAYTEAEEPEILITLDAPGLSHPPELGDWLAEATWHGKPSAVDPKPGYRWPIIVQAAAASRRSEAEATAARTAAGQVSPFPNGAPPLLQGPHPASLGAMALIRQRRSGQRFNPNCCLDKTAFYRMLDATIPRQTAPFDGLEGEPAIAFLIFVLRVDGLPPGLYLMPRTRNAAADLATALGEENCRFTGRCAVADIDRDCPGHLDLTMMAPVGLQELQRLARAVSCHQDIAATGAFSLGMIADLTNMADEGYAYRELLREAGMIGQVLYLEAEAAGVRGTGIGCFFDDPVRQVFGLAGDRWQSVYHFTVGTPIADTRIATEPPYPHLKTEHS